LRAGTEDEIESAFAAAGQFGVEALVIGPHNFFNTRNHQLAMLALRYRVPAIFNGRPFAAAGGLVSYGGSITDQYRLTGLYAGRILKGEKPAELRVQQSTKIDLVINLKTAKALGIEVPPMLLARADEVIE
jgi:putative ABC transport system substrate-binding protein